MRRLTFDYIWRTSRAKDLTANATMMFPPPSGENGFAIIAFLAILVRHPISLAQSFTPQSPDDLGHAWIRAALSSVVLAR